MISGLKNIKGLNRPRGGMRVRSSMRFRDSTKLRVSKALGLSGDLSRLLRSSKPSSMAQSPLQRSRGLLGYLKGLR